jgi:hypothetical protein
MRVDSPPMGFGAAARVSNPSLLLAVLLPSLSPEAAKEAVARGADTCLVAASDAKDREVKEVVEAARSLGRKVARPERAREILGLKPLR